MGELFDELVGLLMHEEEVVQKNSAADILASEEGNDDHMIMPTGTISSFNNGTDDCQDQLEETYWYTQYSDLHSPDHLAEELVMYYTNHPSNDIQPDNLLIEANGSFQENDGLMDQYIHDETTWPLQQQAADNNCQDGHQPQSSTSLLPNLLIDANGSFRENDGETTWPLQQQAADDNYQDGHQQQSSTSLLPAVVPHIRNNDELLINLTHSSASEQLLSQVPEIQERPPELLKLVGEPVLELSKRGKKGKQVLVVNHWEEEGDDALGAAEADGFLKDLVIANDDDHDEKFLMHGEEAVQKSNPVETLASEGKDDHMVPATGTIRCFNNGTDYHVQLDEEANWYAQISDLHLFDHHQNHLGEDLFMYDNNHPSSDIRPNNLSLDVNGYFQENDGLIDHSFNDETTWPLQQQPADNNGHQPQSSTSFIPVVPHIDDNVLIDIYNNDELLSNNHPNKSTSEQQLLLQVQEPQERSSELLQQVKPIVKRTKRRKKGKQVLVVNHREEEEAAEADGFLKDLVIDNEVDDDEDNIGDDNQLLSVASKNLISERIRRKRLNKQLITLRGMVPNITKMDKRSVLVDALAYLQDILHQTKIVMENEQHNISNTVKAATEDVEINHPPGHHLGVVKDKNVVSVNVDGQPQPIEMLTVLAPSVSPYSAIFPTITQVEAEKLDEERYLLKVVYNKAPRAMAQVQRSVEMLNGIQFIDVSVSEYDQHHMQSSSFLRVKKAKGSILVTDAENLVERVKTMVKQLGVRLAGAASSDADD